MHNWNVLKQKGIEMDMGQFEKHRNEVALLPLNPFRHFYLSAKGHYQRSANILKDMSKLVSAHTGCNIRAQEAATATITILGSEVRKYFNENSFDTMMSNLSCYLRYPPMTKRTNTANINMIIRTRIIQEYLRILQFTQVFDEHGAYLNLGEVDETILPRYIPEETT